MHQLLLSSDGLFPLLDKTSHRSALHFPFAGTIQGEGILAGTPSLFLRLAGCNMHCRWQCENGAIVACDTEYALNKKNGTWRSAESLLEDINSQRGAIRHLVITGGEPLLQSQALNYFLERLRLEIPYFHVTIESNGSLYTPSLLPYVDLWSFSPKLTLPFLPPFRQTRESYCEILNSWLLSLPIAAKVQFKFVVGKREDERALLNFVERLHLRASDTVLLMPLGDTEQLLAQTTPLALEFAIKHGFMFSPRLQISLWGKKAGV